MKCNPNILRGLIGVSAALAIFIIWEIYAIRSIENIKTSLLQVNCQIINSDVTRPLDRKCKKPLTLDNNLFRFVTAGNRIEVHEVTTIKYANGTSEQHLLFLRTEPVGSK